MTKPKIVIVQFKSGVLTERPAVFIPAAACNLAARRAEAEARR